MLIASPPTARSRPDGKIPLVLYWGRRGSLSKIVLELARVAGDRAVFCISKQNELFSEISKAANAVVALDIFESSVGAILYAPKLWSIRRTLLKAIDRYGVGKIIVLMPHVWTPVLAATLPRNGVRYCTVVHDAARHPGDLTGFVNRWLLQEAAWADEVITLSDHVARQVKARLHLPPDRVKVLFHPVIGTPAATPVARADRRIGFLFLGRLMAYKGLPLFLEACRMLRERGRTFRIGVAGAGDISSLNESLRALEAETINRWIGHDELETIIHRYDAVVLSHTEASQSGIIPLAYGCGLPVIATPVGGIVEQVEDRRSGLLAREASAAAIADAMETFLTDATLRADLADGVRTMREKLSMPRFLDAIG
jgi:glycosyltransferase involved in cell wall biosynthesis